MIRGRPNSVRVTLTVWYSLALVAVLAVYAAVVFTVLERSLWQQLDVALHEDVEHIAGEIAVGSANPLAGEDGWAEVWSTDGKLLYQTQRAARIPLPGLSTLGAPVAGLRASVALPNGRFLRVRDDAQPLGGGRVIVRAAENEDRVRGEVASLVWIMVLGLPIAVAIAAFGGYHLAKRALLPVERSFAQMQRFTADASHELRTPLTAIRTVGEVALRNAKDEAGLRETVGSMLEEATRLTRLIDAMLMLSRADAGRIPVNRRESNLGALVEEVAAQLSVLAEDKNQSIVVAATGKVTAEVDPVILKVALVNLVDNAIRYSPAGGRIDLQVRNGGREATIDVRDQGPGVPAAHQQRIFERFYRVDEARSRQDGGAGLGLAIARWAVEVHDGRLEVISEPGAGSVFRISLSLL